MCGEFSLKPKLSEIIKFLGTTFDYRRGGRVIGRSKFVLNKCTSVLKCKKVKSFARLFIFSCYLPNRKCFKLWVGMTLQTSTTFKTNAVDLSRCTAYLIP